MSISASSQVEPSNGCPSSRRLEQSQRHAWYLVITTGLPGSRRPGCAWRRSRQPPAAPTEYPPARAALRSGRA